jgi:hypothetical protein
MSGTRIAVALSLLGLVVASAPIAADAAETILVLSGGVGSDERERLEQRAAGYNVRVELADPSGKFEGGGTVVIRDAAGKTVVPATKLDGPQLYAKLPPGRYSVEISGAGGPAKTVSVEAPASGRATAVVDPSK